MFDRFSEDARKMMSASRQAASAFGHDYIGTEHMLLGALAVEGSVAATALRKLGVDTARVRDEAEKIVKPGPHKALFGQLPFTPRAKRVLELSLEEAQEAGHRHIGTGHLLLGLLCEGEGIAARVLQKLGVTPDAARPVVMDVMRTTTDSHDGPPTPGSVARGPMMSAALESVLREAFVEAARMKRTSIEPEDVLVAMLQGNGIAARILRELGATPDGVRARGQALRGS